MPNPWKKRILTFNAQRKREGEKASDMDVVISKLMQLPPGQLKKLLTDDELVAVLRKYGLDV